MQNFKKIKDQLLCHQTNEKISSFCDLHLWIKYKFIDRTVNNIRFKWNLICILRTKGTWNSTIRFSKFTLENEIYKKFEKFLVLSIWDKGNYWSKNEFFFKGNNMLENLKIIINGKTKQRDIKMK